MLSGSTIHLRFESQQELVSKFIVNISVTADSSLLSPTGGVKTIHPAREIHEHFTIQEGYVKVCITTSTPSTSLRPLSTITRVTRRTSACATCTTEHTCTLSLVALFDHSSHSTWLKPLALVLSFHPHAIHVQCSLSCSSSPSASPCFSTSSSCPSS